MTTEEAVKLAQAGDPQGIEYLYTTLKPFCLQVCRKVLGRKYSTHAEDVMQDGFLKMCKKIGSFRGEAGFRSWLCRIMITSCLMEIRTRRGRQRCCDIAEGVEPDHIGTSPELQINAQIDVTRLLGRIRFRERRVLEEHYLMGWEHQELAPGLGLRVGGSKAAANRGKMSMRRAAGV